MEDEYQDLMADVAASLPKAKPMAKAKAKREPETDIPIDKSPSQMGIQLLREKFKDARHKGKLSDADYSSFLKSFDDWKEAKGKPEVKKHHLKKLQSLWKQAGHKK